jgi:hypothetical protein
MPLTSYDEFKKLKESSPTTRNKKAAADGLQPMYSADVFGHVTPPPAVAEKLLDKLKKSKKKKAEEPVEEAVKSPNYKFDAFIKKAEKAAADMRGEVDKADKAEKVTKAGKADKTPQPPAAKKPAKTPKGDKENTPWEGSAKDGLKPSPAPSSSSSSRAASSVPPSSDTTSPSEMEKSRNSSTKGRRKTGS